MSVPVAQRTAGTPPATAGTGHPAYVWCFTGSLLLSIFSGHSGDLGLPIGPDRMLFGLGCLLLLLDPVAWHASGRLRWRGVHTVMVAMLALAAWSGAAHSTLLSSLGFFAFLDRLLVPFLLFCLAPVVYATPQRRDLLLKCLTLLGLYLGVTAILEQVGPTSLVWPRYVVDQAVGINWGRARGPFVASEAMGMALAQCGFAAAVLAARHRGAWRALAVVVLPLSVCGVFLCLTRSVWVGFTLGVVLACLASPQLRRWLPLVLAGGAVALGVLVAAVPSLQQVASERAGTTRSVDDRSNTNEAALRVVSEHPLAGVGWLRFIDVGSDYVRQADDYPVTNVTIEVHNVVLSRAAELGLPGAALWVGCILLGPASAALRRRGRDEDAGQWKLLAIAGTTMWLFPEMLSPNPYPFPNFVVWTMAGIALRTHLLRPAGETPGAPLTAPVGAPAEGRP